MASSQSTSMPFECERKKTSLIFLSFEKYSGLFIMAEQNDPMDNVMSLLESEPINTPFIAPTTNIPALREQLAVLVSTGRCKEATGDSLSQEQVSRLDEKEVINLYKRYEAYVGSKTGHRYVDRQLSVFGDQGGRNDCGDR